jgi:hypothetical protein
LATRPSALLTSIEAAIEAVEPYTGEAVSTPRSEQDRFRRFTGMTADPNTERGFVLEVTRAPMLRKVSLCQELRMGLRLVVSYMWTATQWKRVADDADALDAGIRALVTTVTEVNEVDVQDDFPIELDEEKRTILLQIPFDVIYQRG